MYLAQITWSWLVWLGYHQMGTLQSLLSQFSSVWIYFEAGTPLGTSSRWDVKKWENTLPNSHYISHNVFCDSEPMRLFLNRHRDCLSVLFLGLLKRKQMRILATCVNTISPQVQVESTLLLWLWRSDMFLAAIAYKVFFMTLVMSGHCRDVWSPWQTSWQSTSVTWMRIRIFKVHTASSFGRLF